VVSQRRGVWQRATPVPGLAKLNAGGDAEIDAVSCGSPGNCAAGGTYTDRRRHEQAFVATERNGTWQQAIEIPGLATLNAGGYVYPIVSLSCASAGNCVVGGAYELRSARDVAFVADEVRGTWHRAHRVPGIDALDAHGNAEVAAISCAAAGSCAAVGGYARGFAGVLGSKVFVAVESQGRWGVARALPGLAALRPRLPYAAGISCGSPGNCAIAGAYISRSGNIQSFVADEVGGKWVPALHVAGPRPRRHGAALTLEAVSCPASGDCAAGGSYERQSLLGSALAAEQRHGTWGRARVLAGPGRLGAYADAEINSMSCTSAGNCGAGGIFFNRAGHLQPLVVSEHDGVWGPVILVPGFRALDGGRNSWMASISCSAAGYCAAGGAYNANDLAHAFVVTERNGTWGRARAIVGP